MLRDELIDGQMSYGLNEAQAVTERWWQDYNLVRPHLSAGISCPHQQVIDQHHCRWSRRIHSSRVSMRLAQKTRQLNWRRTVSMCSNGRLRAQEHEHAM